MKNIFFNDEILNVEKDIIDSIQIPSSILMENAGSNSADYILQNFSRDIKNGIIILAGKGSNAGDGFVLARHLSIIGIHIKILLLFPETELKGDALMNFSILKRSQEDFIEIKELGSPEQLQMEFQNSSVIIDAIFGVGFKGELDDRMKKFVNEINSFSDKKIISLDVPSGLHNYFEDNEKVKADVTLTMGAKKYHTLFYNGKEASGKIEVINIGISEKEFSIRNKKRIYEVTIDDVKKIIPVREISSHKYSNGKLLVIGGSVGLTGAVYLSSFASLKTGSGAVVAAVPESLYNIMELKLTEGMILPVDETDEKTLSMISHDKIKNRISWADSILIGPGLSKNQESLDLVIKILKENETKFIVDADGLAALRNNAEVLKNRNSKVILTPHIAEFSNMTGIDINEIKKDFYNITTSFAKQFNCILVLKNAPAIITDGDSFFINSTGRENLATVGTGDVLAGIIAGLYSMIDDPLECAIAGVFIHGMCGDILYEKTGSSSTIASELIDQIPVVKNILTSTH